MTDRNQLDLVFRKTVKNHNKGAISAVLFNEESILYEIHDGMADCENSIPASSDSLYMIASNTKVLTALGILRLWEDGKLDPSDDIRKYIPELSIRSRMGEHPLTIEDLLMHRSGLVCDLYQYMVPDRYTYTDIVAGLSETYRTALPKEMYSYSNLGYTLLGIAIERISGMRYEDFMRKVLFGPLDMEVYFAIEKELPEEVQGRTAKSYDRKGKRQYDPLGCCIPAGSCTYMTVHDLARIGRLLMNQGKYGRKRLYKKKTIEWMKQLPLNDEYDAYLACAGHGLLHHQLFTDYVTGPFLGHGGNTVYHHSLFDFLPQEKIGCIVFSNFENAPPLIEKVQKALLNEYLRQSGFEKKKKNRRKKISTDISCYIKKYDTEFGPLSFCSDDEDNLTVQVSGLTLQAKTLEDGWIRCVLPKPLKKLPADVRELGRIYLKQIVYCGHQLLIAEEDGVQYIAGCRYSDPEINDAWLEAAGEYRTCDETLQAIFPSAKLAVQDKELKLITLGFGEEMTCYLQVLNDSEAIVKGYGRNCRHTVTLKKEGGFFITCDGVTGKKKDL